MATKRHDSFLHGFLISSLTLRNETSAKAAIAQLAVDTGCPASAFSFVVLDLLSPSSCRAAATSLPSLDALVLNAGSVSESEFNTLCEHGVTTMWQVLVLGHALILEKLLADSKLSKGAHVVFAGAEVMRNVPLMIGLKPHISSSKAKIATWPTKQWNSWLRIRAILGSYGTAKLVGSLLLSKVARERPELYMITVSPGGMATAFLDDLGPMRCMARNLEPLMSAIGGFHPISVGAKRYLDAITSDDAFRAKFPSGSVLGSPLSFRHAGATGPLTDQRPYCAALGVAELEDETARVVRA